MKKIVAMILIVVIVLSCAFFVVKNEQFTLSGNERESSEDDDSFKVATSDDLIISVKFQIPYKYNSAKKFRGMNAAVKSKVSEAIANYSMMQIYDGDRSEINNEITEYLNDELSEEYGIEVLGVNITNVYPGKEPR